MCKADQLSSIIYTDCEEHQNVLLKSPIDSSQRCHQRPVVCVHRHMLASSIKLVFKAIPGELLSTLHLSDSHVSLN